MTSCCFKLFFIFMLTLFSAICTASESLPVLNLADFSSTPSATHHPLHGSAVQVRGFWHPVSPDHGVLTATPDVKSCCIQAPAKIHQQLIVKGEIASLIPQRAVTLQGIFKLEPKTNSDGQLIQVYLLEMAQEVPQTKKHLLLWMILSLATLTIMGWAYYKYKRT